MKPEIKKKWLEALRSGDYKQGQSCLKDGDKFCCLGVLEDLHIKEVGLEWGNNGTYEHPPFNEMEWRVLSLSTIQWADLVSVNPDPDLNFSLAELNDMGNSFNYIADQIEKHL